MVWNRNFGSDIKTCQKCEIVLVKDTNWGGKKYICRPCDAEKSRLARLKKKQENPYGYVYVVFNPAWSEWYGVGKCDHNHEGRLAGYNVSSPLRDFRFLHLRQCDEPKILEDKVHEKLRKRTPISKKEWFMLDFKTIVDIIEETYEEEELNV
tara:strand:+ start:128 stop:583 length:456 start_codon:yes stop_codon:yes gene_type:complete